MWVAICVVGGAPSFAWAVSEYDPKAMVLGIVLFAAWMTFVTSTTSFYGFSRIPFMRRSLYVGYGARILLSLALPIGAGADLYPGLISITIVEALQSLWMVPQGGAGAGPQGFASTLLITLVQGAILNLLVSVLIALVWGIQRATMVPIQQGATRCGRCGYDLSATIEGRECPECGSTAGPRAFDSTVLSRMSWWMLLFGVVVVVGLAVVGMTAVLRG